MNPECWLRMVELTSSSSHTSASLWFYETQVRYSKKGERKDRSTYEGADASQSELLAYKKRYLEEFDKSCRNVQHFHVQTSVAVAIELCRNTTSTTVHGEMG